jgi:hypothetical protein
LLAEGLADSSHPKGEHSKGSLIHDNATGILIYRNVYAHNMERSPLLKGGVHAAVVNNLIFDPGAQAMMAKRAGAKTTNLRSSHVPMLSQPKFVLDVIRDAIKTLSAPQNH